MEEPVGISIPMPLLVSIDDVGWWSGEDGSAVNQPFRTGMPRHHVPEDYTALAALGKGLDMKILAGFVLCEWDRRNILRHLPSATWMGENWTNPINNEAQRQKAASLIKGNQDFIEFGLHGVGHEFWAGSTMERTEFHDDACQMREKEEVTKHLDYFFKLMDQYDFDFKPRTFIPPALRHSFGNPENGFQRILNRYGIKYVTLVFDRAKQYARPQTRTIAWENDVLLLERGETDVRWDEVAADPVFKFDRPIMALHWANILHPHPGKNIQVVRKWVRYIAEAADKRGVLVSRDTESAFTQYLHKVLSTVEKMGEDFVIDLTWLEWVPETLVGEAIYVKIHGPEGMPFTVSGARQLHSLRQAEASFLKLAVPKKERKILIRPGRERRLR